jgi:hypothetical protein
MSTVQALGDWTAIPVDRHSATPAHYDPVTTSICEPLSKIQLVESSSNPGGNKTLWVKNSDDRLYYGSNPIGGASTDVLNLSNVTFTDSAGNNPITVDCRLEKLGSMVFLSIASHTGVKVATTYYQSANDLIPAAWRSVVSGISVHPFHCAVTSANYDSDIVGACLVSHLDGSVRMYRELPPGTGDWNLAVAGWRDFTAMWSVATF